MQQRQQAVISANSYGSGCILKLLSLEKILLKGGPHESPTIRSRYLWYDPCDQKLKQVRITAVNDFLRLFH